MLNKNKILNVLFLALIFSLSAVAQNAKTENNTQEYKQGGWWTLGINGGASYQTSDVCSTYDGWGVGLTLAKNVYYRPNALLSFDLRGRLLYANQKGQDWERSYGLQNNRVLNGTDDRDFAINNLNYLNNPALTSDSFYYANHRTDLGELGLEGVINLNRLKEKTNVIVNLYGGLNLDWYKTRVDQAGGGFLLGSEYDYSGISTTDKSTAISSLETLRDYSYETVGDGHKNEYGTFTWMPSAGVELGYQLTPKFSIIGGHKVTWSRADIMDGQRWNNDNTASTNNDIYHYTHLGLRWIIDPHKSTMEPPIIKVTRPRPLPYSTQTAYVTVKAEIENVNSAADVSCTFNGNTHNSFSFDPRSEDFETSLNLQPGRNDLVITATNMAGQDTENVVIIYNEPTTAPTPNKTPPVVKITRPSKSGTTVKTPAYNLNANVKHVDSRSNIKVYLNGSSVSNFSYSFSSDKLESPLTLQSGKNTIKVTGTNKDGSDSDETVIIYEKEEAPCPDPVVSINNISRPKTTSNINIAKSIVSAIVKNVKDRSEIRMYVNGDRTTDFTYNASTDKLSATINVGKGRNEVRIVATTDCGKDEDKENVTYNVANTPSNPSPTPTPTMPTPPVQQPPIVDISTPNNGISTNNATVNLVATVKHVTSKNQIRMTLNGVNYGNFSYNGNSKILKANNVPVRVGTNTIEVKATNNAGTDSDDVLIIRNTTNPPAAPCTEPIVKIDNVSTPIATLANPNVGKSTLYASTRHITSKNQIKLYINGSKTTNFSFNASTGKVTANLNLNKGNNSIKTVVTNNCGTDQDSETITFQTNTTPACPKPTVKIDNISTPIATLANPNVGKSTLYASSQHVSNKNQIQLYLNGSKTSNFSFNTSTGKITANLNLNKGNNSIKVIVTTNCGTAQDTESISFQQSTPTPPSTPKPVVNIVRPTNNATFNTASTNLSVTVFNVTTKNDITVKINGTKTTNFNFNPSTKNVTATINLQEGNNSIIVSATNAGGSDSDSKSVKYVKPAQPKPPVVNINRPSNGSTVGSNKVDLKATVFNVMTKSGITVKLNNVKVSNFSFSGNTVTAQLTIKEGNNTIQVIGKNNDGQDQKSVTVKYVKPVTAKPPTVTITSPAKNITVSKAKYDLKATLTNVKAKKDVMVTLNGKKITAFVYNVRAGKLSVALTLKKGKNTVIVTGVNAAGSDSDSKIITYKTQTPTVQKPTVKIDNVSTPIATLANPNVGKSVMNATTARVTAKSNVMITVNGEELTTFTFNASTGKIVANMNLAKGTNVIEVEVRNRGGKVTDSSTITF